MENPLLPSKTKDPIPDLISTHRRPIHPNFQPPSPPSAATKIQKSKSKGKLEEAILAIERSSNSARPRPSTTYISLLQSCIDSDSDPDSLHLGRRIHASIDEEHQASRNPFVQAKLVSMYAKCGSLDDARRVFDQMPHRNLFAWSAIIGACARHHRWEELLRLFSRMINQDLARGLLPDSLLLPKILQACANTRDPHTGALLHSLALRLGLLRHNRCPMLLPNSILAMYVKCGHLAAARTFFDSMDSKDLVTWNTIISAHCQCGDSTEALRLFARMRAEGTHPGPVTWNILIACHNQSGNLEFAMELTKQMESSGFAPDVFTWTSIISGLAQNKRPSQALDFFRQMQQSGVPPNGITIATAISACASLKSLCNGRELHTLAVKLQGSAANHPLLGNSLVDMYAKCGRLEDARRVFDEMSDRDVFSWNSMIGGYMQAGYCGKAYQLFSWMEQENSGVKRNVVTWNVMISGYIQNRDEESAMELFRMMEIDGVRRDTASWNALIAGSLHNGCASDALKIFRQMQAVSVRPNYVTALSVLPACANLVSAWKVKEIHACVIRSNDLQSNVSIGNALIGAYSKSGDIASARAVFDGLSPRDLISWNSLISAYVLHGHSHAACDLFYRMKQEGGLKPNQATLASIINAYSVLGMVNEGKELLAGMAEEYQISPGLEHYREMVHLFGRSGRLREAYNLIEKMPIEPDFTVWDAFLTAAVIHENVRFASFAAENMIKLEPKSAGRSRRLQELAHYSLDDKPTDVAKARKQQKDTSADISCGCCWILVGKNVHTFVTGGEQPAKDSKSCMYSELNDLGSEKKASAGNHSGNYLYINDEDNEEVVGIHCEKLAIAFALVNIAYFRRSIRIIKSSRMCRDCHTTVKMISRVHEREIFLKDPKCLHHFKEGKCSCRDYW